MDAPLVGGEAGDDSGVLQYRHVPVRVLGLDAEFVLQDLGIDDRLAQQQFHDTPDGGIAAGSYCGLPIGAEVAEVVNQLLSVVDRSERGVRGQGCELAR